MLEFFNSKERSPGFKKFVIVTALICLVIFGFLFYWYDRKDQEKMRKYVQDRRAERQKIMAEKQKEAEKKQAQIIAEQKPETIGAVIWKDDYPGKKKEENSQERSMIFLYTFLYGPYDSFTRGYNIMMKMVYRASSFPKIDMPPGGPDGQGGPGGNPGGPGGQGGPGDSPGPGASPGPGGPGGQGGPPKGMPLPYEIPLAPIKDVETFYKESEKKLEDLESFNPETMDIKRKLAEVIALQKEMVDEIRKSPKDYDVVQKARQTCITCNKKMRTLHRFMLELCKTYPDTFSQNWLSFIQRRLSEWDKVVALDKKPIQFEVPGPKGGKKGPPEGMKPPGGQGQGPGGQPPGGGNQGPGGQGQGPGGQPPGGGNQGPGGQPPQR